MNNCYIIFFIIIIIIIVIIKDDKESKDIEKLMKKNINKLIRQTSRWATAAEQDTNPYIANLHATYALGYLMSIKEIYTNEEIKLYTNVDIMRLEDVITKIMDDAINKLSLICPEGQPKNEYLAYLSKEGKQNNIFL